MNTAHPLGIATRQVVVDRDKVDTLAAESVEVDGERGDERLTLSSFHLGDPAEVERRAAHHLNVIVTLADDTIGGLAGDRERFDQDVVEGCTVVEALTKLASLGLQLVVGQATKSVFECIDVGNHPLQCLEFLAFSRAEDAIEDAHAAAQPTGADVTDADAPIVTGVKKPGDDSTRNSAYQPNPNVPDSVSDSVSAFAADITMSEISMGTIDDDLVRARTRTEFDQIFTEHYARLVRALTIVAGDAEAAADAVQEAFVKAHLRWRKISRYDDPVGWVRRVAINQLRDDHRRTGRKRKALSRLSSLSETTTHATDIDEFDRLLAELPRQQRATTALFYVDGLTVTEIADALEIAEGTVKSHLHDARNRLRPVLEREHRHRYGTPEGEQHE